MPVRCAWCGCHLSDDTRLAGESHGICPSCEQVNFPERGKPPTPRVSSFDAPESRGFAHRY